MDRSSPNRQIVSTADQEDDASMPVREEIADATPSDAKMCTMWRMVAHLFLKSVASRAS
jgi:hypothetical protein